MCVFSKISDSSLKLFFPTDHWLCLSKIVHWESWRLCSSSVDSWQTCFPAPIIILKMRGDVFSLVLTGNRKAQWEGKKRGSQLKIGILWDMLGPRLHGPSRANLAVKSPFFLLMTREWCGRLGHRSVECWEEGHDGDDEGGSGIAVKQRWGKARRGGALVFCLCNPSNLDC